jgi:hypothetical protein
MSKQDPLDPRVAPNEATRSMTADAPEPEAAHDRSSRRGDGRASARAAVTVVATGEGGFGVIWNGVLRPERYPTKGIACLAIAALERHASPSTAPPD